MNKYKCKFTDLVDDLVEMDVIEITMDDSGILIGICDALEQKGIKVNRIKGTNKSDKEKGNILTQDKISEEER
ncbi:hypothetical protein KAI04_04880 [Candidatus Pacearchaeota archaeon]|nr:hypothetical protein [Candidatus Pacearchaeota archaeon]